MIDLTTGNSIKQMIKFALPVCLGNIFQLFYSLADTRIVGSTLGESSLASVGATTSISTLLIGFLSGMTNGFSIVVAQQFGEKNEKKIKKTVAASLFLGLVISVIISIISISFLDEILKILNVSEELYNESTLYIKVILLGITATMFYNAFAGILRAIGDTFAPLMFLIIACGLNIFLDLFFILKLGLGVSGAGLATVISQGFSVLLCIIYMWKKYPIFRVEKKDFFIKLELLKRLFYSGFSMAMMMSLVFFGTLALQTAINTFGTNIIVAHTASRKLTEFFMLPFSVFGITMATYCGQNKGANEPERIKKGIWEALFITWGWSVIVIILSYTIAPFLIYMVTGTTNREIILTSQKYLRINTIFYFVPATISILRNAMQGIGDHFTPIFSSGLELIGKISVVIFLVPSLEYFGIIISEPIVWVVMVIPLIIKIIKNPIFKNERKGETYESSSI
ncbi:MULTISPECIES: MATE family efflux transporter [Fusobacterium]|uniref:MATE family efflux transporter n=1 Tax=Fusobacterium TaxID=848 RepID=UPI001F1A7111|nr:MULTISPECIES: MATE family efflux transporter [Fusobacterium]MCF2612925.1 MATE family efflux transporter [Fusobacterium perfoetens]MDY2981534.1 MATE family efflux transporter [Fusobacterium sp.]